MSAYQLMQIAKALQLALDATRFEQSAISRQAYTACISARLDIIQILDSMNLELTQ